MALAMQGYAGGSFDPGSSNLFDLHVQCMTGEGLLLKVSPSMLGRRVRQLVLQKLASKRGAKLLLHHGSAALALNQTLQEQGIVSETKTLSALSATYMPANLYAAACFLQGLSTSEEALEGLTCLTLKEPGQYLRYLPESLESLTVEFNSNEGLTEMTLPSSLQTLTFYHCFNQSLERVTLPPGLQTLSFGDDFNQSLERVTLPPSLQTLTLAYRFNQSLKAVIFPEKLEHLLLGWGFRQDLEGVVLPSSLKTLGLREAVLSCR